MSKYIYKGANSSMRVANILFAKGVATELSDEQVKALKANDFGKVMLENKSITEVKEDAKDETKADAKTSK